MRFFLKLISYIFHPLFIPMAGTAAYFITTPKYSSSDIQNVILLPTFILTVIIPIITYLILKNLGVVHSVFMPTAKERKYPLYINILLLLLVIYKVLPNYYVAELHFYFLGIITASMTTLMLILIKVKASMHLMGMGSLLMFLIGLSIHFEINITLAISLVTFATGLVTTSRLYLKAHSKPELLIGFLIGLLSQLLMIRLWL
ncbi:hypothetical protein [Pseudozobellia thermophila]|uniref:PAP2 superfamily protein n=1 Tax=Pseudozobellia thermophila TaxID=192903 RepID=A0A1M6KG41_9FLAO|nr:hypothetical protein [Pseudozobellia thermophila]SHJ57901.1 hypothetical protein SAMN04488513_10651 [Pseudozobellia thermophila]